MRVTFTTSKKATHIRILDDKRVQFALTAEGEELRIGIGTTKPLSRRKTILFARRIISIARQHKCPTLALTWSDLRSRVDAAVSDHDLGEIAAVAWQMANFEFTRFKTKKLELGAHVEVLSLLNAPSSAQKGIARGLLIGEEVNACRYLANTPGGDITPRSLGTAAKAASKGTNIKVSVLGVGQMTKLGMGAILGVGKGSAEAPQFIVMEYFADPKGKKTPPLVLVGKGVTFDSGGLNVKPGDSMLEMHMDMSGGAAVIHAVALAAKLKVKKNVVGLIPAVENMPSGTSYRPGDILRSMSGKTIEVLNTDAEGRIILADALTYAKRYNPKTVIEASTLTGAVLGALGQQCSAVLSTDDTLVENLRNLGEQSGDYLWPLPMWEEYNYMVEGGFGDVPNIPASGNTRYAGVIGGGKFLEQFAEGYSFAHLDIASRMTAAPGEFLSKGAAGAPVRLFLAAIENL